MREYAVDRLARRLFADTGMPFQWSALTADQQDGFFERATLYIGMVDDCRKLGRAVAASEYNPYYPEAPEDGHHLFENGSYRCAFCAVYNRPDVPSTKEILDQPCKGNWDQSGKMKAWADDKWAAEKAST